MEASTVDAGTHLNGVEDLTNDAGDLPSDTVGLSGAEPREARATSRRTFLQLSVALGLGGLLAACGGSAQSGSVSSPSASAVSGAGPVGSGPTSGSDSRSPAASSASPAAAGSPSGAIKPLSVAYTTINAGLTPLWIAESQHIFSQRRVDVKLQYLDSLLGSKAMIANEIDVLTVAPASSITADVNAGQDLVMIASMLNRATFVLNTAASIKTVADLRGKVVGTDQPGSANQFGTLMMLADIGLKPTDVTLRPIGVTGDQYAALVSGLVQAATLTPPFSFQAKAQGYPILTTSYKLPYQSWTFVIRRSRIDQLGPSLVPFLQAIQQSVKLYESQPELAMNVIQQYTKETDKTILKQTYDFYRTEDPFQADLQPTTEGIQGQIDFLGNSTVPAAKGAKASQFVDTRFLSQLASPSGR